MTAMAMDIEPAPTLPRLPSARNDRATLVAAFFSLALHVGLGCLLAWTWAPSSPVVAPPATVQTQIIMLPTPPAPQAAVVPPPPEIPAPAAPTADIEQAALAKKRLEERHKREAKLREQQRQAQAAARAREEALQQAALEQETLRKLALQREALLRETALRVAEAERVRAAAASQAAAQQPYLPMQKTAPDYPERALDSGIEGDCTVSYIVNPQGRVEQPQIVGECHPLFVKPSIQAAQKFRYQPRIVDGQPQAVLDVKNTFHYRIEE